MLEARGSKARAVPATSHHARELAPKLRAADLLEIKAARGFTLVDEIEYVLREAIAASWQPKAIIVPAENDCPYCPYQEEVIGVFGCVKESYGEGFVWMMGSDKMLEIKRDILQFSKVFAGMYLARYPYLWTWMHPDNHVHRRWLEWMGFKEYSRAPYGYSEVDFIGYHLSKEDLR